MSKTFDNRTAVTARDLSIDGDGICVMPDGKVGFVPDLLPGEEALISVTKQNSNYAIGVKTKVLRASPFRANPSCSLFGKCGGCSLQHMSYEGQLDFKGNKVLNCLRKIGGFENPPVNSCLPSPLTFRYRNKLSFPVSKDSNGKIFCGCYEAKSHKTVPVSDCILHSEEMLGCLKKLVDFLNNRHVSVYDEKTGKGCVRHITVRESSAGSLLACFVVNDKSFPEKEAADDLKDAADTLVLNYNFTRSNVILGSESKVLFGRGRIEECILGKTFDISENTFFQVNYRQTENLYNLALSYADIKSTDTVADLYCGVGTITLCGAEKAKKIYGIEIVPQSIENAKANAITNNISNAEFICGDAGKGFSEIMNSGVRINCIILDPPRKGLSEEAVSAIISSGADRIVYVSCDPATLARDLKMLADGGYDLIKVTPVDMFPQTVHVETVCLLTRKDEVHRMRLNLEPFEMIKNGTKTIELRLFDEKRQKIKVGDSIIFTETVTGNKLSVKVEKLHMFDSFEKLYESLPLLKCGYTEKNVADATPSDMEEYYSAEEQKKYGVVGIEISRPTQITDETVCLLTRKDGRASSAHQQ